MLQRLKLSNFVQITHQSSKEKTFHSFSRLSIPRISNFKAVKNLQRHPKGNEAAEWKNENLDYYSCHFFLESSHFISHPEEQKKGKFSANFYIFPLYRFLLFVVDVAKREKLCARWFRSLQHLPHPHSTWFMCIARCRSRKETIEKFRSIKENFFIFLSRGWVWVIKVQDEKCESSSGLVGVG